MRKAFTFLAFLLVFAAGAMAGNAKDVNPITPVDTIDVTLDNAMRNGVFDFIDQSGTFYIVGCDSIFRYEMYLKVCSDHIAGEYTSDDIEWRTTRFYDGDSLISVNEVRDFTVTGDADTCSTYVEMVSSDSVLYRMNFVFPGVLRPVTPVDTIDITMAPPTTYIADYMADYSIYYLYGDDQSGEYFLQLAIGSDQIAGSFTRNDVKHMYTTLMHTVGKDTTFIHISDIHDFTVTGDTMACSTYVEIAGTDSVLYRINFAYDASQSAVDNATESVYAVYNEGNAIIVNGAEGEAVTVYDMAGRTVMGMKAAKDVERIEIAVPGIYVVRIGNRAFKALVK